MLPFRSALAGFIFAAAVNFQTSRSLRRVCIHSEYLIKKRYLMEPFEKGYLGTDFPKSTGPKDMSGKILFSPVNFEKI